MRLRVILLWICGLWLSSQAGAAPVVNLKTNYYYIQGQSPRELRHSMNAQRPKNQTHDAFTVWNVTWSYTWRNAEGGGVLIHQPKITVTINTTLPRWSPPKDTDKFLVDRWTAYIKALALHENGHAAYAIQAGRDLEQRLATLGKQPSAELLKQTVDMIGHQLIAEAREKEKRFDEQTHHGMKQGARFP
ncbi:MAG TPA: DUF922 domain-containing protein [Verrucomicrobiae bacterium]